MGYKLFLSLLVGVLFYVTPALSQENAGYSLIDSTSVPGLPEEHQDIKWYLFETKNFEVLSIDWEQGNDISNRVEELKTWTQRRWGFEHVDYLHKCMILCVPSDEIYLKWFRRENISPKIANSKNPDGSDRTVYGIWISGRTGFLSNSLPELVGRVNVLEHEQRNNVQLPYWFHIGTSTLNNDIKSLRVMLGELDPNYNYLSNDILNRSFDSKYNVNATVLCLLLKKQSNSGEKIQKFLAGGELSAFGWRDTNHLDISYNAFTRNLAYDIRSGVTPDMGLTWFVPKED